MVDAVIPAASGITGATDTARTVVADGFDGGDTIVAGDGANLVFGDNARIVAARSNTPRFSGQPITLGRAETIEPEIGGSDSITTGAGADIVFGGVDADTINAGNGNNIVIGDSGYVDWVADDATPNDIDRIAATDPQHGGNDDITTGTGNDIIIAGEDGELIIDVIIDGVITTPRSVVPQAIDGDTVHAGAGNDLVFGDFGVVEGSVDASQLPLSMVIGKPFSFRSIYTSNEFGGNDRLYGEDGEDIIIGGQKDDVIYGGNHDDDLIGGNNIGASASEPANDGNDRIDGGTGNDVIAGDNARIERRGDTLSPSIRVLIGSVIYGESIQAGTDAIAQVTDASQPNPTGVKSRVIELFDHSDTPAPGTHGNDYLAGGPDNDLIFGQLGDDVVQGDGAVDDGALPFNASTYVPGMRMDVGAARLNGLLVVSPSVEATSDGDDYIEGNGGNDVIFGNLGQDDIVGGSSSLYGGLIGAETLRPDGSDLIFGGAGTDLARNNFGDALHARDADVIAGDNANILRLRNGSGFLTFNYDNYGTLKIIPRAVKLIDYTPGGPDFKASAVDDNGAADEIHGESGDDSIYGMKGNDVLFGEGQDDDLIGGWGHDWIAAGTGDDGVLGDDGRIYTSRNGTPEPLYGLAASVQTNIATPGNHEMATIFPTGLLNKTVNLTPFNDDPNANAQDPLFDPANADDIIYGGLGNDFLHGGAGDDAISGAEALAQFYDRPVNRGNVLRFAEARADEFLAYDEFNPMRQVFLNADGTPSPTPTSSPFLLNFNAGEGPAVAGSTPQVFTDGNDMMFGDLGNDWMVGGTGRDWMFGGFGADLLNADDDQTSAGGENNVPDGPQSSYEDFAYGGAGRDVLIANTGGDRLIDWVGEFNSYLVPFSPFGMSTISRMISPALQQFLYDLSRGAGADRTRAADTGADPLRNGEPYGEMGLVNQKDNWWQDQTGAPDDPQPGNTNGKKDVLRSADFNNGSAQGFAPDSGTWTVQSGALFTSAATPSGDAVAIYHVGEQLPSYYEIQASINAVKPTGGWKANSYVVFDYQSPTDFKFAGIDVSNDKVVLGHRAASGWVVDVQAANFHLKPDTFYNLLVAVNGLVVTVTVDNAQSFSYAFAPRMIDGVASNLNWGYIGFGSENARGKLDNIQVKVLERPFTLVNTETFDDGVADLFTGLKAGAWQVQSGRYLGSGADPALSLVDLGLAKGIQANARTELTVTLSTAASAGLVFDLYSTNDFKFVLLDTVADRLVIGHRSRGAWTIDASAALVLDAGKDYTLLISLAGTTVSTVVDGRAIVGFAYNAVVVDGAFGTLVRGGSASFNDYTLKTSDSRFKDGAPQMLSAAAKASTPAPSDGIVTQAQLDPLVAAAIARWAAALGGDIRPALAGVVFVVGNLDGAALAQTVGHVVVVDADAAGWGWFIDGTPGDDKEFPAASRAGESRAPSSSGAYGRMDLLTVLMHEIGHLLGFAHGDPAGGALMEETLQTGLRRLPVSGPVSMLGHASVSAGSETQHVSFNASSSPSQPAATAKGAESASATASAPSSVTAASTSEASLSVTTPTVSTASGAAATSASNTSQTAKSAPQQAAASVADPAVSSTQSSTPESTTAQTAPSASDPGTAPPALDPPGRGRRPA